MSYSTFTRTWWSEDPKYPNGLRPDVGRKSYHSRNVQDEDAARQECQEWNATHKPGRLSRKMEFESN